MSKLAKIVAAPGMKERIERAGAKLDAQDAGWIVLDPKRRRAEQAVIRLAHGISEGKVWYPDKLAAALARLDRVTGAKGDAPP